MDKGKVALVLEGMAKAIFKDNKDLVNNLETLMGTNLHFNKGASHKEVSNKEASNKEVNMDLVEDVIKVDIIKVILTVPRDKAKGSEGKDSEDKGRGSGDKDSEDKGKDLEVKAMDMVMDIDISVLKMIIKMFK